MELAAVQLKIGAIADCFIYLKKDKEIFNTLDDDYKRIVKQYIIFFKFIYNDLDKILKPIAEKLSEEM